MGDREAFEGLVAALDYPMFIVTARAGGENLGCLIGFATQASIHPARFLIGLSEKNRTFRVGRVAEYFAVHFVPDHRDDLAQHFGGQTGDEVDKFAGVEWEPGPGGTPLLSELPNRFVGRVLERTSFGDHCGFLLEPVQAEHAADWEEFSFHRAKRIQPGHAP